MTIMNTRDGKGNSSSGADSVRRCVDRRPQTNSSILQGEENYTDPRNEPKKNATGTAGKRRASNVQPEGAALDKPALVDTG